MAPIDIPKDLYDRNGEGTCPMKGIDCSWRVVHPNGVYDGTTVAQAMSARFASDPRPLPKSDILVQVPLNVVAQHAAAPDQEGEGKWTVHAICENCTTAAICCLNNSADYDEYLANTAARLRGKHAEREVVQFPLTGEFTFNALGGISQTCEVTIRGFNEQTREIDISIGGMRRKISVGLKIFDCELLVNSTNFGLIEHYIRQDLLSNSSVIKRLLLESLTPYGLKVV